jgi:hypothetical protein
MDQIGLIKNKINIEPMYLRACMHNRYQKNCRICL